MGIPDRAGTGVGPGPASRDRGASSEAERRARMPALRPATAPIGLALALAALASAGCELTEVTVAEPEDLVVVEGLVQLGPGQLGLPAVGVSVFLHRTIRGDEGLSDPVPGAEVTLVRPAAGAAVELVEAETIARCVTSTPLEGRGTCYTVVDLEPLYDLEGGERLELRIALADGGVIRGAATLPGDFRPLVGPPLCSLAPDASLELRWSRSEGAWAYLSQAAIFGLPGALAARGIEFAEDPLELTGFSISAADTTIVFPAEFGVFERADLDREVAVALQKGLPPPTRARIAVVAVDRNYVNWQRGGNFNPSGTVRVPSVQGDGTGSFGAALVEVLDVEVGIGTRPACGPVSSEEHSPRHDASSGTAPEDVDGSSAPHSTGAT